MEEQITGIYCITNKINSKKYVGQSRNIYKRWKYYKNVKSKRSGIVQSIIKYGIKNFKFEILEKCKLKDLNDKENHWIKKLNTMSPNGYNLVSGGGVGIYFSEETIEKRRLKNSGENHYLYGKHPSKETREKMRINRLGKPLSKETREKISKSKMGNPKSKTWLGKRHSKETRGKMSKAQSGENHPMYGKSHTIKTKQKLSKAKSGENHPMYGKNQSLESRIKSARTKMYGKKIACSNGEIYESILEASIGTNSKRGNICSVLTKKQQTTNNLIFWYIYPEE